MLGLAGIRLYVALGAAILVALLVAYVWRIDSLRAAHKRDYEACKAAYAQFVADVKAKTELARLSDAKHKAEVEAAQEKERADHEAEIQHLRADYSQRVRDYAKAHPGSRAGASLPRPANAPSSPAPASAETIVPVADLEICAANTALAESWQSWWKEVAVIPR